MQASLSPVQNGTQNDSGFIMLDALLAVTIAALGLGIILTATQTSRKSSDLGTERREALARLQILLEATPRVPSSLETQEGGFRSHVEVSRVSEGHTSFCQIGATLTSLRSKRVYELKGLRWCPSKFGGDQ